MFTNPEGFWSVINTLIWALIAPIVSTVFGLAYAVFIDRARGEKILKVLVFMPVAISFVGAGIIWKFIYDYRQGAQIGLLNAIVDVVRRQAGVLAGRHAARQHRLPADRVHLDADRVRDGDPVGGDQGRADGAARGGVAGRRERLAVGSAT